MYRDWLGSMARRFQARFDEILTGHNFDYGPEFEIALCQVLEKILPKRAGICRGYIVSQDDQMVGDDIIIFDANRFPVLRSLGNDLSQKEQVPAEAVLAYIEAKHTLYLYGDGGQSLTKAMAQTMAIKQIVRTPLEHRNMIPGLDLGPQVKRPPTLPDIKNPWYTAIWSRRSDWGNNDKRILSPQFANSVPAAFRPDMIATDEGCLLPCAVTRREGESPRMEVRPFICPATEHTWSDIKNVGLGVAAVHLLWAIEWMVLSEIPWNPMMTSYLRESNVTWSNTPRA
jgi:hypothetical protein